MAVFSEPVVLASKDSDPTAVFSCPEVKAVNASLPIAVFSPPVTEASKALSPRTVLPATEFAPLPTVILLTVESAETVRPVNVPTDVIFACAAVARVPFIAPENVDTPVTTIPDVLP